MLPPYITDRYLDELIERALDEDIGDGDITTQATIDESAEAAGLFRAKEDGILAGLYVAERVLLSVDSDVDVMWSASDGDAVKRDDVFGVVRGPARSLLMAERVALNILQRMSGIATATRRMVDTAGRPGVRILDTRKTAPGLRLLDKWAVGLGGGRNHRIGLFDMILIKDNHIEAAGGIRNAVEAARRYLKHSRQEVQIEVEARTLDEVIEVLAVGGVNFLMLDNMVHIHPDGTVDTSLLQTAVEHVDGRITTEASGNVTIETVRAIAETGVDSISCGALTHSARALDISLKIRLGGGG
jgi:nicotinate-nucleotide pyrophosphorylase (carboxylating)